MSKNQVRIQSIDGEEQFKNIQLQMHVRAFEKSLEEAKETEAQQKRLTPQLEYFADTWNVLRFIKGTNCQGVLISPDGLTLSITQAQKSVEKIESELCLTNMAFTHGVHFWEINAQISCQFVQAGVYNPVTKTEHLMNFTPKTPRNIFVCLDLFDGSVRFWLNEKRKNQCLKLPIGGPWIPCVKIGHERNVVSLNPFATPPAEVTDFAVDRSSSIETLLMPLLQNTLCVTNLPQIPDSSKDEAEKALKKLFKHSYSNIVNFDSPPLGTTNMFVFIRFHHYTHMVEFLEKHRLPDVGFKIHETHEILDWFKNQSTASEEVKLYLDIIKQSIKLPSGSLSECANFIKASIDRISANNSQSQAKYPEQKVKVDIQPFSDKLIISNTDTNQIKIATRHSHSKMFEIESIIFAEEPQSVHDLVPICVEVEKLKFVLQRLPYRRILLKEGNINKYLGALSQFFKALTAPLSTLQKKVVFGVPLYAAKISIDAIMWQINKQISTSKESDKADQNLIASLPILECSASDLEVLNELFLDMHEQLYARTRSDQCVSQVKQMIYATSMPLSPLNRLAQSLQLKHLPAKSLDYLLPKKIVFQEVISSQNSPFILLGNLAQGSITVTSSLLQATALRQVQFFSQDIEVKEGKYLEIYQKFESRNRQSLKFQTSIAQKQTAQTWFSELNQQEKQQPNQKSKSKKGAKKATQAKLTFKKQIAKNSDNSQSSILEDPKLIPQQDSVAVATPVVEIKESINSVELLADSLQGQAVQQKPQKTKKDFSQIQIAGFLLLSQSEMTLDPLIVGCVYKFKHSHFIKLRKILFQMHYITHFVNDNVLSGNQQNLISGFQQLHSEQNSKDLSSVLQHGDCLLDMHPIFVRNQVLKKQYPKWESRLSLLSDATECEIEIEDCSAIVDFSRVNYSVNATDYVYVLCQNKDNQLLLKQFKIFHQDTSIPKIKFGLRQEAEVLVDFRALRVFSVDDSVVVCSPTAITVYDSELQTVHRYELSEEISARECSVINETSEESRLNFQNQQKLAKIPNQKWTVFSRYVNGGKIFSQTIKESEKEIESIAAQPDGVSRLESISEEDLIQMATLFKTEQSAPVRVQKSSQGIFLSEKVSGEDQKNLCFKILGESDQVELELETQHSVASFDIQLIQKEAMTTQIQARQKRGPVRVYKDPMQIPLSFVSNPGFQAGKLFEPTIILQPDSSVYSSKWSKPEFIFKTEKPIVLTAVEVWSKITKEGANGFPIGQGLVFAAENVKDLQHTKRMSKSEFRKWAKSRDQSQPLAPWEPVLYFDMKSDQKIEVPCQVRFVQYFKFVATEFRSEPINYRDVKQFDKYSSEIQFFGIKGVFIEDPTSIERAIVQQQASSSIKITQLDDHQAKVLSEMSVSQSSDSNQTVSVQVNSEGPNIFRITIPAKSLSQITLTTNTYKDFQLSSSGLGSSDLRASFTKLECEEMIESLVQILQGSETPSMRQKALLCLRQLLLTCPEKVKGKILEILQNRLQVQLVLSANFTGTQDIIQRHTIDLLDSCGMLQKQVQEVESFLESELKSLSLNSSITEKTIEPHTLKNLLCLVQTQPVMQKVTLQLQDLLVQQLERETARQEAYYVLRGVMKINAYPFDAPSELCQVLDPAVLAADFQYIKINTSYFLKVHLQNPSKVSDLRLIFKQDSKSVHRLKVTIVVEGRVVHSQIFPESVFDFVADKAHKHAMVDHFSNVNQDTNEFLFKTCAEQELNSFDRYLYQSSQEVPKILNQITIPLSFIGQSLEVQVELLDTYKSVYKQLPTSQIVITPEVLGYAIKSRKQEERKIPTVEGLAVCGTAKIFGRFYQVYTATSPKMPNNFLFTSFQEKNMPKISQVNDQEPVKQEDEVDKEFIHTLKKLYQQLCEKQKTLANHLTEQKGNPELKIVARYMTAINKVKLEIRELATQHREQVEKVKQTFDGTTTNLQYTHNVTKIIVQFLHKQFLRDPTAVKNPHNLHKLMLKCMIFSDCGHEKDLLPILNDIFTKATPIEQAPNQIVALIDQFVLQPKSRINIQSVVNFLLSENLPQVPLEKILKAILQLFEQSATCPWPKVEDQEAADQIFTKSSIKGEKSFSQKDTFAITALIFLQRCIEKRDRACIDDPQMFFELLTRMIADHIVNCDKLYSGSESLKAQAFVSLSMQVLTKFLSLFGEKKLFIDNNEGDMIILLLSCAQSDQEESKNSIATALQTFEKSQVARLYKLSMGWLQNRDLVLKSRVYRAAERQSNGQGGGFAKLFTHYSSLFKMFVGSQGDAENLKVAQEQLNIFIQGVFTQLDSKVEPRKMISVLIEIYQNLPYMNDDTLSAKVIKSIVSQLHTINPCDQDFLISSILGKIKQSLNKNLGISIALQLLGQFLTNEEVDQGIKYRFCIGMANLFATGDSETSLAKKVKVPESETTAKTLSVNLEQREFQLLIEAISEFLSSKLSFIKTPSSLIYLVETAQNVKIANRLLQIVLYNSQPLKLSSKHGAVVRTLLEVLVCCQCNDKTSNAIIGKSVIRLFDKVKLTLEALGKTNPDICISELLKLVATYDADLLAQVKTQTINDFKAWQIQDNLNQVFESLLTTWLVSEEVASKFLSQMQGFDFMISRLRGAEQEVKTTTNQPQLPGQITVKNGSEQVLSTLSEIAQHSLTQKGTIDDSNSDIDSDEEVNQVLEYLQQQTGMKLVNKPNQTKIDKVLDDETMLTAARQKTILKKQTAIFTTFVSTGKNALQQVQTMPNKSSKKKLDQKQAQPVAQKTVDEFTEIELSKSMRLVDCSEGQTVLNKYSGVLWNKTKQQNQSAAVFNLTQPKFLHEYYLTFDLGEVFQLQETVISFNLYPDTFKQVSTISVIPMCLFVEGYLEEPSVKNQEPVWKQCLTRTQELSNLIGYFVTFGSSMIGIDDSLKDGQKGVFQVGKRTARFLRFVFKLQDLMSIDASLLTKVGGFKPQTDVGKAFQVAQISITGAKIQEQSTMELLLQNLQRQAAIRIISSVLQGKFAGALQTLGTSESLTDKIIQSFDFFAQMLATQYAEIKPVFVTLCQQSQKLSDWLIEQKLLMNLDDDGGFGSAIDLTKQSIPLKQRCMLLFDILQSRSDLTPRRLNQVLSNILAKSEQIAKQTQKEFTSAQECCAVVKVFLTISNALATQELVFVNSSPIVRLEISNNQVASLIEVAGKLQKQSQRNSVYSLITFLIQSPKPFQSDLNSPLGTSSANVQESKASRYLQTLIEGGLSEQILQNLIENETVEDIEALRLIRMNLHLLKTDQILQLYDKLRELTAVPKTFTTPQLNYVHEYNVVLFERAFKDKELLRQLAVRVLKDIQELGRIKFNKFVALPFLTTPKTTDVKLLHVVNDEKSVQFIPFYQMQSTTQNSKLIDTNLLSDKDLDLFQKHIESLAKQNAGKFIKSAATDRWERIYHTQPNDQIQTSAQFEKFAKAIQLRKLMLVLMQIKSENEEFTIGYFSPQETQKFEIDYNQDSMCTVYSKKHDFVIYASSKHSAIMPAKDTLNDQSVFMTVYTDYADSAFVQFFSSFQLSFSSQSKSYFFNTVEHAVNIQNQQIKDQLSQILHKDIELKKIEIWTVGSGQQARPVVQKSNLSRSTAKKLPFYKLCDSESLATWSIKFSVPSQLTLKELKGTVGINESSHFVKPSLVEGTYVYETVKETQKVEEIVDKYGQLYLKELKPEVNAKQEADQQPVEQQYPGFEAFCMLEGSRQALITAALLELQQYQKLNIRELYSSHLSEVQDFSKLTPDYLVQYLDKTRLQDVIQIIEHKPDIDRASDEDVKKIKSQMRNSFCHALNVLNKELKREPELVKSLLTLGVFGKLIERVGSISGESKRRKASEVEPKVEQPKPQQKRKPKTEAQIFAGATDKIEKKGVGYTTSVGEVWDVEAYLLQKLESGSIITQIIQILEECVSKGNFDAETSTKLKIQLLESSLLPTMESAFRSGSLLEMAKELELYLAYLQFTLTLAKTPSLFDVLLDIGEGYEPRQKESIFELIKQVAGLAEIFLNCMNKTEGQKDADLKEAEQPQKLAEKFIEVFNCLKEQVQDKQKQTEQIQLQELLAMPLELAHRTLCKPLRFKYMNMEKGGTSKTLDHYFANQAKSNSNPPTKKLIRLAQEIADLTNSLPAEHTSAVFCRVAQKKVDYMKCLIMGAEGTPYAHGAFVYDVYFSDQYPDVPPKVQLVTTGGGTIRFNPNLYAEGKVCLSLLGTWRGQSTENWDAKVSTVLQVLLSIQAIIMSNEVYFNEPGHEQELGTPHGEKLNRGYSNIVRYGNAKFAILEQLRNPAKGFEDAIKASFFLKKDRILADIQSWIDEETTLGVAESNYNGLVMGHNAELAKNFSSKDESQSYLTKLKEVLEELKTEFSLLKSPYHEQTEESSENKSEQKTLQRQKSTIDLFEDIDMAYEQVKGDQEEQKIDINDEKVKDRWSRYIGAMGIESVAKQAEAVVFISGLGATGVEIAKNIILAGCKELILFDIQPPTFFDLSGQFFITEEEVQDAKLSKKSRAQICKIKLQQLNTYVKVTLIEQTEFQADKLVEELINRKVRIAVFSDSTKLGYKNEDLAAMNQTLRQAKVPMILADQCGLFSRIINDFGTHTVNDLNGEEVLDIMIQQISIENDIMLIKTIQNHDYQDGDEVLISKAVGLEVQGPQKIEVVDVKHFRVKVPVGVSGVYKHNGISRLVKKSKVIDFASLKEVLFQQSDKYIDGDLRYMDFEKLDNQHWGSIAFKLIESYSDLEPFVTQAVSLSQNEKSGDFFRSFFKTKQASFGPLAAYLGGIVAQEIVKAITQKFKPISQEIYLDLVELYHESSQEFQTTDDRLCSLVNCFGLDFVKRIQKTNLFMVGAGAIGCELLKNFAMLSLGALGQITLTDPDVIEVSNLNRQFLFREKHLRKPKSHTAAAAAIQMNPTLKGHISARLDKVHGETVDVYSEEFFKQQDIVANALDNVAARIYVDSKCLSARTMLIDSGTLGPKGHVQVICPFKTENYASQEDAQDNNEIPHCTLKMFPEETLHCVEWAKDLFGQTFTLQPQNFNKLLMTPFEEIEFDNQTEQKGIQKSLKLAEKTNFTFADLIRQARKKFQKLFHDNILQLIHVYPLDKVTAEGRPFWALPKRPPRPLQFNPQLEVHRQFVAAYACLLAQMRGVDIPGQARSEEFKQWVADEAAKVECKQFTPNDAKAQEIESQVNKQQNSVEPAEEKQEISIDTSTKQSTGSLLKEAFKTLMINLKPLSSTEFEKDVDSNFHVDFIFASANARAQNYELAEMDWITVKIKAGKIVPALATTTAAIAALQTIEILKLLKVKDGQLKINSCRNTFLNMAGPYLMMSEPGEPVTNKLTAQISVNVWDRWEVTIEKVKGTLYEVLKDLAKRFAIEARDVFMGAQPLFFYSMRNKGIVIQEQEEFKKPFTQLLKEKTDMLVVPAWVDLTITFVDLSAGQEEHETMLQNVPTVRVILN